jgi:hypothetical protein
MALDSQSTPVTLNRLADAAEKLLRETERLRRDVRALNMRIERFEDDTFQTELSAAPVTRAKWNAVEALNVIEQARQNILNSEHEVSAIRARMDTIEGDVVSREDMKPWIKTAGR